MRRAMSKCDENPSEDISDSSGISQHWRYHAWSRGRKQENDKAESLKPLLTYGLVALVLIALFIVTIISPITEDRDEATQRSVKANKGRKMAAATELCIFQNQGITQPPIISCDGLNLETSLDVLLNNLTTIGSQGVVSVGMTLTNTVFKEERMTQGWLPLTELHPKIISLTIHGGNLKAIEDRSLSIMDSLEKITIENTDLKELYRNGFKGLKNVTEFSLWGNTLLSTIENGFLHEFSASTVQIQDVNTRSIIEPSTFFRNLTGDKPINSVETLDLQRSEIAKFPSTIIPQFPELLTLRVEDCSIESFETMSFAKSTNLKQIFLSRNNISTLKEDVFGDVIKINTIIYADGNPIKCDCQMKWLQQYIIDEKNGMYGDFNTVTCETPETLKNEKFLDVDLCQDDLTTETPPDTTEEQPSSSTTTEKPPSSSSTTEEPPTSSSSSTTEEPPSSSSTTTEVPPSSSETPSESTGKPPELEFSNCSDLISNNPLTEAVTLSEMFNYSKPSFQIDESNDYADNYTSINLTLRAVSLPAIFIYFSSDSDSVPPCQILQLKASKSSYDGLSARVFNISADTNYLFCLFDSEIRLMNCMPYRTQPTPEKRTWLLQEEKVPIIGYIVGGVLTAILFVAIVGPTVAFFVIKKHPTLLEGSERVEIVRMRNEKLVLVLPEGMSRESTSTVYDSISGYITVAPRSTPGSIRIPPPVPPMPKHWLRRRSIKDEEHVYLEPRNMDLLIQYEWYTQRLHNEGAPVEL